MKALFSFFVFCTICFGSAAQQFIPKKIRTITEYLLIMPNEFESETQKTMQSITEYYPNGLVKNLLRPGIQGEGPDTLGFIAYELNKDSTWKSEREYEHKKGWKSTCFFGYEKNKSPVFKKSADGKEKTVYEYNNLGLCIREVTYKDTSITGEIRFAYDTLSRLIQRLQISYIDGKKHRVLSICDYGYNLTGEELNCTMELYSYTISKKDAAMPQTVPFVVDPKERERAVILNGSEIEITYNKIMEIISERHYRRFEPGTFESRKLEMARTYLYEYYK